MNSFHFPTVLEDTKNPGQFYRESEKDGKKFGSIMVRQDRAAVISSSFIGGFTQKVYAFLTLPLEEAQKLSIGAQFDGANFPKAKLVITESQTPLWEGMTPKINPTTKAPVLVNGKPVFRNVILSTDLEASDTLVTGSRAAVAEPEKPVAEAKQAAMPE